MAYFSETDNLYLKRWKLPFKNVLVSSLIYSTLSLWNPLVHRLATALKILSIPTVDTGIKVGFWASFTYLKQQALCWKTFPRIKKYSLKAMRQDTKVLIKRIWRDFYFFLHGDSFQIWTIYQKRGVFIISQIQVPHKGSQSLVEEISKSNTSSGIWSRFVVFLAFDPCGLWVPVVPCSWHLTPWNLFKINMQELIFTL